MTGYWCTESWRLPHTGGTVAGADSQEYSAEFHGVGGMSSTTLTTTYNLTATIGYQGACLSVADNLVNACNAQEGKCFNQNGCTPEDL
jgi:hypothetical protein